MHPRDIHIPLRSRTSRLAVILLIAIPAAALSLLAGRIALAARFGSRFDVADLQRAIALDPGNAAYDHQLGLVYVYSLDQPEFREAIKHLKKATELNPRNALYWSDLAEACDMVDDAACSDVAVRQALRLSPKTPRFEWKAANHYLQTGRADDAIQHFRHLLELDPTYAQPVFQVCLRATGNPSVVLHKVLSPGGSRGLKLAFLDFASRQGDLNFAGQVWNEVSSDRMNCKFSDVKPYVESLLAADEITQAALVWRQLEQSGVVPQNSAGNGNLVYNGAFSHAPLNAGFDWRAPGTAYVEADFNDPSGLRGSRCLRVDYAAGRNLESEAAYEFVPVVRGKTYRLQAYARSEGITSESGPRLRVVDPHCPACLDVSTVMTVGTTPWHQLALNFTAGESTQVVRLSVWRARSRTFPMEISGSFWLDDVSITVLDSMPREEVSAN